MGERCTRRDFLRIGGLALAAASTRCISFPFPTAPTPQPVQTEIPSRPYRPQEVNFNEEQTRLLNEIKVIYTANNAPFYPLMDYLYFDCIAPDELTPCAYTVRNFRAEEIFVRRSLPEGREAYQPEEGVLVNVSDNRFAEAIFILKIAQVLFDADATKFLRKIESSDDEYFLLKYDPTSGQITLGKSYHLNSDGYERVSAVHELAGHAIDLASGIFDLTTLLELELAKTKLLFLADPKFGPVRLYDDLYSDLDALNRNLSRHIFYQLGSRIYGRQDEILVDPRWDSVQQKIREYETDGFSEMDMVRLGRHIFEGKSRNIGLPLSGSTILEGGEIQGAISFDDYYKLAFSEIVSESFAALIKTLLSGWQTYYELNPEAMALAQEYLSLARGETVDIYDLVWTLRNLDQVAPVPYTVVE